MKTLIARFVWWLIWLDIWPGYTRSCWVLAYEWGESLSFGPLELCYVSVTDPGGDYNVVQVWIGLREVLKAGTPANRCSKACRRP